MELVWGCPEGLSARRITDELPGETPALTTVLTVLERLRAKGRLHRSGDRATGYVYAAAVTESESVVTTMLGSLTGAGDRQAALLRFAGQLDRGDAEILRQALEGRTPGAGRR